jgi:hypothetical protein
MPQYQLRITTPYGRLVRRIAFYAVNTREAETMAREISVDQPSQLWCAGRPLVSWGGRVRDQRRPQVALGSWAHVVD